MPAPEGPIRAHTEPLPILPETSARMLWPGSALRMDFEATVMRSQEKLDDAESIMMTSARRSRGSLSPDPVRGRPPS